MEQTALSTLPSLIFIKILRLLSVNFDDVRRLSYVCKSVRQRVMDSLSLLYHLQVELDNNAPPPPSLDPNKPVISLRLLCSADLASSTTTTSAPGDQVENYSSFVRTVSQLNLSSLKSLEIRNLNLRNRKSFDGLRKLLPLNQSLNCSKQLECLKIDVTLINLSEIRNSIINVLYQHDDFATGGPITNIDYIVNSTVSFILFSFLQFVDELYSASNEDVYDPYGRCQLSDIEMRFLPAADCDWGGPDLTRDILSATEETQLRECLEFMINEFRERIKLKAGLSRSIKVEGIPNFFYDDTLQLVTAALEESTKDWSEESPRFRLKNEKFEKFFNLLISFDDL